MASDDRTEKPTSRRLTDARKRGQIARSQDLSQAAGLAAALATIGFVGSRYIDGLATALAGGIGRMGMTPGHDITAGEVTGLAVRTAATLAILVGPIALAAGSAVVAAQ